MPPTQGAGSAVDPTAATLISGIMRGAYLVAAIGVVAAFLDPSLQTLLAPVASLSVASWCRWMVRRHRFRPQAVLAVISLVALAFVLVAVLTGRVDQLASPVLTLVAGVAGVVAVGLAPVDRQKLVGWGHLGLVVTQILVVSASTGSPLPFLLVEGAAAAVVAGLGFYLTGHWRRAVEANRSRYEVLVDTTPAAVVELDLTGVQSLLAYRRLTSLEAAEQALQAHPDLGRECLRRTVVRSANRQARTFLQAEEPREVKAALQQAAVDDSVARSLGLLAVKVALGAEHGEQGVTLHSPRLGRRHLQLNWNAARFGPGRVTVAAIDVTARREAEEALAEQVRSRDRFVAAVSHEIRTPLTAVLGLVQELHHRHDDFDPAERHELMGLVLEQTQDVVDIVQTCW